MWRERQMQVQKEEKRIRESLTEMIADGKSQGAKSAASQRRKLRPVCWVVFPLL